LGCRFDRCGAPGRLSRRTDEAAAGRGKPASQSINSKAIDTEGQQRLMGASLLVFKNKSDVPASLGEEEIRQVRLPVRLQDDRARPAALTCAQALQLDSIKTHRWKIISCSAVTGLGLKEGLDWVVRDAKERLFLF
jgi:hypothetical protein